MWKLLIFSGVLCCGYLMVYGSGHTGPGKYNVIFVEKCEDDAQEMQIDVNKKKINRTHDGFNAHIKINRSISSELGIRVQMYRKVDGGYKLQHELADPSLVDFVYRYAKSNAQRGMKSAGIDPPDFPIPPGEYNIENFTFDYREMPRDGMYGEYIGKMYIMDGYKVIFCIGIEMEFNECDNADDEECNE